MPPERLYAAQVVRLELEPMREAARMFVGEHDFGPFSANPLRVVESTVRQVDSFTVGKRGALFTFSVSGNGFLYKQVRSMVGFLVRVGTGPSRRRWLRFTGKHHGRRKCRLWHRGVTGVAFVTYLLATFKQEVKAAIFSLVALKH